MKSKSPTHDINKRRYNELVRIATLHAIGPIGFRSLGLRVRALFTDEERKSEIWEDRAFEVTCDAARATGKYYPALESRRDYIARLLTEDIKQRAKDEKWDKNRIACEHKRTMRDLDWLCEALDRISDAKKRLGITI